MTPCRWITVPTSPAFRVARKMTSLTAPPSSSFFHAISLPFCYTSHVTHSPHRLQEDASRVYPTRIPCRDRDQTLAGLDRPGEGRPEPQARGHRSDLQPD